MVTDDSGRERLTAALEKVRRRIRDVREGRLPPLGEENTKTSLIEPILAALGWDVTDPAEVFKEYSQPSVAGRVDYALLVGGTPALFVEAKDLGKDLSDPKWLDQMLRYTWMTRVPCCLLTNGDDYHLYAVRESQSEDDEIVGTGRVSDPKDVSGTLELMSQQSVSEGHLKKRVREWHVDRRVKRELLDLLTPESPTLARWLRGRLKELRPAEIRSSLGRARLHVEFPVVPITPPPPPPPPPTEWGVRAFRPPLRIEATTNTVLLTKWRPLRKETVVQRVSIETVLRTAQSACALAQRGEDVCVPAIRREPTGPKALGCALQGVAALLLAEALTFARASAHAEYFTVAPGHTPETMVARVQQAAQRVEPSHRPARQEGVEADRHTIRRRFWTQLLTRAAKVTKLHAGITPGKENWLAAGAGRGGLSFCYVVREHDAHVELYIDRGKGSDAWNTRVFEQILSSRPSVEAGFGQALEWQPLDGKRACRIRNVIDIGGYRDERKWPEIHDAMIDAMVRLERALRPRIAALSV